MPARTGHRHQAADPARRRPRDLGGQNELVDFETYALRARRTGTRRRSARPTAGTRSASHRASAFDFDDLLVKTVELFQLFDDVLDRYRRQFRHILVDEWQDTNRAQYEIVHLLAAEHRNLCVVGDADQSIYGFRGADIRNILEFERDFPDATRITLERNYRSTQTILDAANAVIANNVRRLPKNLWTDAGDGVKVVRYLAENEQDEAAFVAEEIDRLGDQEGVKPGTAPSLPDQRAVAGAGGGADPPRHALPGDRRDALLRAPGGQGPPRLPATARQPRRRRQRQARPQRPAPGIGAKSREALDRFASQEGVAFLESCRRAEENPWLGPRAVGAVLDRPHAGPAAHLDGGDVTPCARSSSRPGTRTGYLTELQAERTVEALGRERTSASWPASPTTSTTCSPTRPWPSSWSASPWSASRTAWPTATRGSR